MRHTVIGVFDTYAQAENARAALMAAGFSHGDIELQANPKRDDAAEPSLEPDVETHAEPGMLANIERFFSMLFGGREQPPEVAHYSEAVRRGAVLVAIDTNSRRASRDRAHDARRPRRDRHRRARGELGHVRPYVGRGSRRRPRSFDAR